MAVWQCVCCGGKVDDQEDNFEALEVENEAGRIWYYYHTLCLDDLRTIERKLKDMGTPEKSPLPKKVRGSKGSWSGSSLLPV